MENLTNRQRVAASYVLENLGRHGRSVATLQMIRKAVAIRFGVVSVVENSRLTIEGIDITGRC